ncbi:MAG: zf-HC2 domain-containing protein [Arthrobacter sp.]|uniref:zf-HC2 domain-containing protein n=1 Tax=unclassified Arthrobacter TaxID=235627 RepID=UPI002655BE19|nr:zf-HC2 domain-containing protein [Micrococcaceae bacterium]MDN5812539.1 zf-HC2 domain-containing protein [Micrococcaceae bacterium]MDN5824489.1 zf-HC2 domain-containing protein [Micrococcaceae bacterium]MDN5880168.1 zf-HC2 domain-containing protein [Micrococcaceae bacterium]MDN5887637.1 zf-HC2 domain-containing protein [Micrococcaceae bacterium]
MHRHGKRIDGYLDGELNDRQRAALEHHVGRCADCRLRLEDRRRLKRRLQSLGSTAGEATPDDALMGRLRQGPWSMGTPTAFAEASLDADGHSSRLRSLAPGLAATAMAAMLTAVVCAAWVLGGTVQDATDGHGPLAGAWSGTGTELSRSDLGTLRAAGWNCPTMSPAGLELVRATGSRTGGIDQVTLEFTGDQGEVVLTESRTRDAGLLKSSLFQPTTAPEQPRTHAIGAQESQLQSIDGEAVSVAAVDGGMELDMRDATYSLRSSLDGPGTDAVKHRIVATEHARLAPHAEGTDGMLARLGRGMSRLLVLDTDY